MKLVQPATAGVGVAEHQAHGAAIAPAALQDPCHPGGGCRIEIGPLLQPRVPPGFDGRPVLGVALQRAVVAVAESQCRLFEPAGDLVCVVVCVVEAEAAVAVAAGDDVQLLVGVQGDVHDRFLGVAVEPVPVGRAHGGGRTRAPKRTRKFRRPGPGPAAVQDRTGAAAARRRRQQTLRRLRQPRARPAGGSRRKARCRPALSLRR